MMDGSTHPPLPCGLYQHLMSLMGRIGNWLVANQHHTWGKNKEAHSGIILLSHSDLVMRMAGLVLRVAQSQKVIWGFKLYMFVELRT